MATMAIGNANPGSLLCPNYISIKTDKNPTTDSQDIVHTRACRCQHQHDPHKDQYVTLPVCVGT